MKYFTKEELEDITTELIGNPTRETLKKLNEKYNENNTVGESLIKKEVNTNVEPPVTMETPNPTVNDKIIEEPFTSANIQKPQVEPPIPSFDIPNMEIPKIENQVNNNVTDVPSFELPKLETPTYNNQHNEPVSFSGDLWNIHTPEPTNLMQTTDNFNTVSNQPPVTDVPVNGAPFFRTNPEPVNNPIPVQGPTMFGQLEQNYM